MQCRMWLFTSLLFVAMVSGIDMAHANQQDRSRGGIGTDRTRYIYPEGARQVGVTLRQDAGENYLVQAWVRGLDPVTGTVLNESTPFFLKQPLVKAMPDGRYGFQVIKVKPVPVKDRESVYLLSFKLIPAEKETGVSTSRANVVMTYNVKLFYRPEALKNGKVASASKELRFFRTGDALKVSNPTPYWITFYSLQVGGHALSENVLKRMVPPFGEVVYSLPSVGSSVIWQIIDENGDRSTPVTSSI
ncbi:fimbrial biogenesis chaperone [Serratia sp. CY76391]|uniref:fimbrial biogenesis chaperone n=1 Tax=Serratia sp. CY76391 TaxID=3383681 RepID=UPI003F9FE642